MEKYKTCDVCGHTYPLGHPCMTCRKKRLDKVSPKTAEILEFVKILRVEPNDILLLKSNVSDEEKQSIAKALGSLPALNKTPIMFINSETELIVLRNEDSDDNPE